MYTCLYYYLTPGIHLLVTVSPFPLPNSVSHLLLSPSAKPACTSCRVLSVSHIKESAHEQQSHHFYSSKLQSREESVCEVEKSGR